MSIKKIDDEFKDRVMTIIGTEIMYELRCEHCGRFHGYYSIRDYGNGVMIYCTNCKGWTVKHMVPLT